MITRVRQRDPRATCRMNEVRTCNTNRSSWALLCAGVAVLVAVAVVPRDARAATLGFAPASGAYAVGKTFTVRVVADTGGESLRGLTAGGSVTFDPTLLTAVSAAKDPAFSLCTPDPTPNNTEGTVVFGCGTSGSAIGQATIFTITFKVKKEGTAQVSYKAPQLLVGGVSKLVGTPAGATYTLTPHVADPPTETTPSKPAPKELDTKKIPPPNAPVVDSSTHPDQTKWYNATAAKFSWDFPYGVIGVRVGFDQAVEGTSSVKEHEPPIGEWGVDTLTDGTWYLQVQYRNRGGWGSSTVFKVQVDTTPPEPFTVTASGGDLTAQLVFETRDTLSGVVLYRVSVDGTRPTDVQPRDVASGSYTRTNLDPGEHVVKVVAVDAAGNERTAEAPVLVTGTKPLNEAAQPVQTSGFGAIYWVSLLFMAALAVAVTVLVQERRRFHEEKEQIKREAMEAGDKLINIFGVLRDEIEEKVLELSHKPNMTDTERNVLEELKDALDVSEELIDKEIEDVRKLLK